jgi:hypothetical protein
MIDKNKKCRILNIFIRHGFFLRDLRSSYRSFATRVSQLKFWHFSGTGIERSVCRCTFNGYSVIMQFAKLPAGEQLCSLVPRIENYRTSKPLNFLLKNHKFWVVTLLSQMSDMCVVEDSIPLEILDCLSGWAAVQIGLLDPEDKDTRLLRTGETAHQKTRHHISKHLTHWYLRAFSSRAKRFESAVVSPTVEVKNTGSKFASVIRLKRSQLLTTSIVN